MMQTELKVEYIDIEKLTPYERNCKIHTPEQIRHIATSIEEFGFNDPLGIWRPVSMKRNSCNSYKNCKAALISSVWVWKPNKSALNKECLRMFNLERLWRKSRILVQAKGFELFYAMLEKQGVCEVYYYTETTSFDKHYGYFVVK